MHDGLFRQTETPELIENSGVYTFVLFYYQALACHLLGLGEMHYLEHGRRDIAELAALAELAGIADNNERNRFDRNFSGRSRFFRDAVRPCSLQDRQTGKPVSPVAS